MLQSHKKGPDRLVEFNITRRDCLRYLFGSLCLVLTPPLSLGRASEIKSGPNILDKFLGEELRYQIGYWLIGHVADAKTEFLRTDLSGIYRLSLQGNGTGFLNYLLGGITYGYTSFCQYVPDQDMLRPVYFELKKQRGTKKSLRSVSYNYKAGEIKYLQTDPASHSITNKEPMGPDRNYEDYLTLFFNFRNGHYGPLKKNHEYELPLYTKEQMDPVKVHIADDETEKSLRSREFKQNDKDFFVRFKIPPEDVSSESGEILGWFSNDIVPVKGTIQDVIFFGDLWGELKHRQMLTTRKRVQVPVAVKNMI